jgi:hypothetical protein
MIFKKTIIKKIVLALIALFLSYTSNSRSTASTTLTPSQLVETIFLGSGVAAINITYNVPFALSSQTGSFFY